MSSDNGVRLTLKFNFGQQIRGCGWSEGYDLGYSDLPTAINSKAAINAFMQDRVYCLGQGPVLVSAGLSAFVQPVTPGAPLIRRNTLAIQVPSFPDAAKAYNPSMDGTNPDYLADFSPTVFYINLQTSLTGTPVYHRNCWIAGMPDGSDRTNTNQVTLGEVLPAFNRFLKDLDGTGANLGATNTVSIRSIDRSAGNPVKQCQAWNINVGTYRVDAHGFAQNQPVLAEGMKCAVGGFCPRGRYLVNVIDANTISLQGATLPNPPIKLGGFRAAKTVFNPVGVATPDGFSKRNKGRPFDLLVGKSRRQLIKRA